MYNSKYYYLLALGYLHRKHSGTKKTHSIPCDYSEFIKNYLETMLLCISKEKTFLFPGS